MSTPKRIFLQPTSLIPNNKLPLLLYKGALDGGHPSADDIEARFESHGWKPQWRYGMFSQAHYHSNTHEALGVFSGSATCRFGAADAPEDATCGEKHDIEAGDVLVIPAGVAHQAVQSRALQMVGAYPKASPHWNMCYGGEAVECDIAVPRDPLDGSDLAHGHWRLD